MRILPALLLAAVTAAAQNTSEAHLAAAKAAAGTDYVNLFNFQCYGPGPGGQRQVPGAPAPARGAGQAKGAAPRQPGPPDPSTYHVWAITTSQGIIVMDTIFDYSVEDEVVNGMKKLGLNPADIKYAVVSHPHPDHDGGAFYLQEHFGTKVIMSPADWAVIDARTNGTKPRHDLEATDGQKLTLGDTTVTMYILPGHTPGTISSVFQVKDGSTAHTVALWGGAGLNQDKASVENYIKAAQRFSGIAKQAGADIILANHTDWDGSKVNLPALAKKTPGMVNPYIVGNQKVLSFLKVAEECALSRVDQAR
jgi:metallo-beta-lactamase class B